MENILNKLLDKKIMKCKTFSGTNDGEKVFLCYSKKRGVIVVPDFVTAVRFKKGLDALNKRCEILSSGREVGKKRDENLRQNASFISKFLNYELDYLIFLPVSMLTKFSYKKVTELLNINKNSKFKIEEIETKLVEAGYTKLPIVEAGGEFAVRGDIVDIFPTGQEEPIRIEFFDDEIEKIYHFDLISMKKTEDVDEFVISNIDLVDGENDISSLCETIIIDLPDRIENEISMLKESYKVMSNYAEEEFADFDIIKEKATMSFLLDGDGESHYDNMSFGQKNYLLDFLSLSRDLKAYLEQKMGIVIFAGDEFSKKRIGNFLAENSIPYFDYDKIGFEENKILISEKYFPHSFSFIGYGVVVIGTDDVCKTHKKVIGRREKEIFYLPKLGDYVVHKLHGIGKCVKIERMKLADFEKDYFVIEYQNGDMFYLPSEHANTLSAYVGGEETPKMNKLGGRDFFQLKERVKAKLKDFALDLVALYKERENAVGYKMNRDEFLEQKFENAFEYEETEDQMRSIQEIDGDMTSSKIMDRLVCGDVGFGKTEVAFRACFKAVYNGKQVAFLCPTTILSEQHFLNAKKRMEEFGVRIALLNRFKSVKETKEIEEKIANGQIDIVIGTQKLLAKTVNFKNLGLLVVDEEQRFGVADKEKIKDLKKNVDVLALSATPIPRTLHMSLAGIRDISIIDTPPKDRLPIQTYVAEESDELIENVAKRELSRNGKVFIIYNRVMDIYGFAERVKALLPESKVGVAHGQMTSSELKKIIDKLYRDEYNVFISTTLIENGIDLPTANSMIIINADKLGLSQMYQLRGRIGRSDKLAYCYLMYERGKALTMDAYKRLDAIKEFRQLGSGFKVAMRDLEIRGAGNIFGKEQHGHIEKVGYDMYVKLLDEVVKEIKGEKKKEKKDVKLNVSIDAYIPEGYIPTSEERIAYYVKISDVLSRDDILSVLDSLRQGFGQVPFETENLCYLAYLKNLAGEHNIESIKINRAECKIYLEKQEDIVEKSLVENLDEFGGAIKFEKLPVITFKTQGKVKNDVLKLINFFEKAKNYS